MPKVFFGVAPDDDDEYQEPFARVQWGRPGRLTSLKSQRPEKRPKGEKPKVDRWRRREIKLAGWVEKTQARAIRASGNQFQVKNRDGRVRGHYRTVEEADAKAAKVKGGFVTDRVEGRRMEGGRTRGRRYEVPDRGVFTAQVSDEQWPDERDWPGQYQSTEEDYLEEWR